ncbi:4a-hydroxytetrahydrobiopterin dehydratase [Chitinibacteraceae bacterium HSL-7]
MSLTTEHCQHGAALLSDVETEMLLTDLADWVRNGSGIERTYRFHNFHETMAFVNAVAWVAHTQNHHPELEIGFGRCKISYTTHSAGGITRNDFIAAAHIDALTQQEPG